MFDSVLSFSRSLYSRIIQATALLQAMLALLARVLAAGFAYLLQIFLAQNLGIEHYGIFVTFWTWQVILTHIAVMGFDESIVKYLPRYLEHGRTLLAYSFMRHGMKFILASSAITSVCLGFFFLFAQDQLNQLMHGSVIVLLVGLPVLALELYVEGVARAHGRYLLGIVPGYVLRPIAVMAILFGLRFAGVQLTAEVALAAVILSTLLLVAMQGAVLWRSINNTQQKVAPKRLKRLKMMWIKASLPLVVITGVEELFYWSDVVILGFMVPPAEISIYFAALRVMAITNFIHYAFMFVFAREFSVAHAGGDADFLRRKVTTASSWTFWLTVPAIVLILLSGPLLLSMFGEEFLSGQVIMLVIGVGILGKSLVGPAANLLIVTGYARQSVVISFVALITNVVISVTLILFFGIIGAAIGTAIAQIFRSIMIAIYCKQKMSVNVLPTLHLLRTLFSMPKA